jgi:hypothetical protein
MEFLDHFCGDRSRDLVSIDEGGKVTARSFAPTETADVQDWLQRRQGVSNLYFHVNELRQGRRNVKAKKADIARGHYLHVDVDDPTDEALGGIREFLPAPTVIVWSGGGYHAYWWLGEPCSNIELLEQCNKAIAEKLGGDNCHNADRIMRLPGTLNIPNAKKRARGRTVTLARVLEADWSRQYLIEQFERTAVDSLPASRTNPDTAVALVELADLPPGVDLETRGLIRDGDDLAAPIGSPGAHFPSRSEAVFRVACELVRAGLSDEQIAGVLTNPAFGISASILEKKRGSVSYALRQAVAARAAAESSWPDTYKSGAPRPTLLNTKLAIQRLGITAVHDNFHKRKIVGGHVLQEFQGELSDDACAHLRSLILEHFRFDPGRENTRDAATGLCLQNTFNPVADYLDGLTWDGARRIDTWLIDYTGAADTPLNRAIGRVLLVAAVRRVRTPGTKFDQIVVLEGPQGSGKSTALLILAGGQENFSDADILTLDPKAQMEALEGVWIYEICELEGMSRADTNKVKAFASRPVDRGRPAYGRFRESRPRECVFVGTTNDDKYLRDQTGNRRFWPVRTATIDLDGLKRDRNQLWAEAAALEARGEPITLPQALWADAAVQQEERLEEDPWLEQLAKAVGEEAGGFERIATGTLLSITIGIEPHQQQAFHTKRLVAPMRKLGWEGPKSLRMKDGRVVRGYERPATGTKRNSKNSLHS